MKQEFIFLVEYNEIKMCYGYLDCDKFLYDAVGGFTVNSTSRSEKDYKLKLGGDGTQVKINLENDEHLTVTKLLVRGE